MKLVLLDCATLGDDVSYEPLERLGEVCYYDTTEPSLVAERIAEANVVIVNKIKLNGDNLANAKSLRLICITATGFDNIDLEYCRSRGIAVCNVVGYSTQSVAQVTVTMALELLHRLPEYTHYVKDGRYERSGVANSLKPVYHETSSLTWGIIGYGNIGRRVGDVAKALGFRVLAFSRTHKENVENVSLEELCSNSNVISIHTPLNDETRNLIGEKEIVSMPDGAILVNVARGGVWSEEAVANGLLRGKLGGVGADVYSREPLDAAHPFSSILDHPAFCPTPHMAWGAYEARVRLIDEVGKNIQSFSAGERRNRLV